jgi:hypothetical protein
MFLPLTTPGEGMNTNTAIFLSVYVICMAAVLIALILRKR